MLNRVVVLGRLTKDPELRKSASNVSFATFSIAVDNTAKEADGTRGTLFIDCRIFGTQAESLVKNTRKGSKITVDGSINQRNFIRQDGTKGKAIEIYADSVTFLEPKKDAPAEEPKFDDVPAQSSGNNLDLNDLPDDDLPFKEEEAKPQKESTPKKPTPKQEPKYDPYTGKPLTPKGKK